MIRPRSITRRLVILCALLVCLMAVMGFSTNNSRPDRAYLPCCSACDVENPPLACRHGCSPSCAQRR